LIVPALLFQLVLCRAILYLMHFSQSHFAGLILTLCIYKIIVFSYTFWFLLLKSNTMYVKMHWSCKYSLLL